MGSICTSPSNPNSPTLMSTGSGERAQRTDSRLSGPHRTQDHLQAAQGFLGARIEEHCWSPAKARSLGGGGGGGGEPDLARRPRVVWSAVPPVSGHVQRQRDHGVPEPLRGVRQTMNEKDTRAIRPTAALHSKQRPSSGVSYSDRHEGVWTQRCEAVQQRVPLLQLKSSLWGFLKTETGPPARSSCQPVMLVGETFPLQMSNTSSCTLLLFSPKWFRTIKRFMHKLILDLCVSFNHMVLFVYL